jgi:hypothetical protein
MQQCYLFQNDNGTITPLGKLTGTLTDGVFGGTVSGTVGSAGVYTYAVTCGGVESGFATFSVGGAKAATTTLLSATTPVTLGQQVTLTATPTTQQSLGAFTGQVAFSSGGTGLGSAPLTNGSASVSVAAQGIARGTYNVTATYSGDGNYQPSSVTTPVVVLGYPTAATVTASSATITQGQSETLTTKITRTGVAGNPTGTVTYTADGATLGSAQLVNGVASFTAPTNGSTAPGSYTVTASYAGDTSDQPVTATVPVKLLAATQTAVTVTPDPIPADSVAAIAIRVSEMYGSSAPTGTVALSVAGTSFGSVSLTGGTANLNESDFGYPQGTYPLTVTYPGDANNAASSYTVNITVE